MTIKTMLIGFVIMSLPVASMAQTKKIAHRSHNGSSATLSYDGADNFGLGPEQIKQREEARKNAKLDSTLMRQKADSLAKEAKKDSTAPKKPVAKKRRVTSKV